MAKTYGGGGPNTAPRPDTEGSEDPASTVTQGRGIQIRGAGPRRADPAISAEASLPFVATWRGGGGSVSYTVTDTEVLPNIREERLVPGANAAIQNRDGEWDLTDFDFNLARSGAERLVVDACVEIEGTPGAYRPVWASVRRGLIVSDTADHHAWLRALYSTRALADGPIPRPTIEDLELLRADLGAKISRLAGNAAQHNIDAHETLTRRLRVVEAAIAAGGAE